MSEEIQKVLPAIQIVRNEKTEVNPELRLTLVLVALNLSNEFDKTYTKTEDESAYYIPPESLVDGVKLPGNFDVVCLTSKGIQDFMTKYNFFIF